MTLIHDEFAYPLNIVRQTYLYAVEIHDVVVQLHVCQAATITLCLGQEEHKRESSVLEGSKERG
jgi:hypothetical protein